MRWRGEGRAAPSVDDMFFECADFFGSVHSDRADWMGKILGDCCLVLRAAAVPLANLVLECEEWCATDGNRYGRTELYVG